MRRLAPLALVWTLLALTLAVVAAAAAPPANLPDGPTLVAMALAPSDFARARVETQGHQEPGAAVAVYSRDFAAGARAQRSTLLGASNDVVLFADETAARATSHRRARPSARPPEGPRSARRLRAASAAARS